MRKSKSPYVHQASLMCVGTFFNEAFEITLRFLSGYTRLNRSMHFVLDATRVYSRYMLFKLMQKCRN